MMDRNTLTALLLITVVLIITPYYMDLISPATKDTQEYFEDQQNTDENGVIYKDYNEDVSTPSALTPPIFSQKDEKTIEIENDLFVARISSAYGGTIRSFKKKSTLKMTVV